MNDCLTESAPSDARSLYRRALRLVGKILVRERQTYPYWADDTRPDKARVLELLQMSVDRGMLDAYPLLALLESSNDWRSCTILRPGQFRCILLEGIGRGCLAPGRNTAWEWLGVAARCNDPALFMDDMDRYYELLFDAAAAGNPDAREIMNVIWEPEQIVEED